MPCVVCLQNVSRRQRQSAWKAQAHFELSLIEVFFDWCLVQINLVSLLLKGHVGSWSYGSQALFSVYQRDQASMKSQHLKERGREVSLPPASTIQPREFLEVPSCCSPQLPSTVLQLRPPLGPLCNRDGLSWHWFKLLESGGGLGHRYGAGYTWGICYRVWTKPELILELIWDQKHRDCLKSYLNQTARSFKANIK